MCGRYTLLRGADAVAERFEAYCGGLSFGPRYNIAPTQAAPIVVEADQGRQLLLARWGLIPFWARDPAIGDRLINARAETIAEKPSFKHAFARRRCIVPATGFYEWKRLPTGSQPYYIRRKDHALFGMAGLWDTWESPDGSPVVSFTIITARPNAMVAPLHNRMPAILSVQDEAVWLGGPSPGTGSQLDAQAAEALLQLLRPYPEEFLTAYPVSRIVNNPSNEDPRCVQPLPDGPSFAA